MGSAAIFTSRNALIHAALAHISPELQTIDSIIHHPQHHGIVQLQSRQTTLPIELLLIIRSHLLPAVTIDLIDKSTCALEKYESSVRSLLCADCLAWNQDIYGSDIWQWVQFSGACSCQDIAAGMQGRPVHSRRRKDGVTQNPKQFLDSSHWLEWHLSCELLHSRGYQTLPAISPPSSLAIWEIVIGVLRQYDCELRDRTALTDQGRRADHLSSRKGSYPRGNNRIAIVPLSSEILSCEGDDIDHGGATGTGDGLRAQVMLHRVDRDLGLSMEYMDTFDMSRLSCPRSCRSFPARQGNSNAPALASCSHAGGFHLLMKALHFITTVVAACLSIPVTFATVAVTIFCYYSRPTCLRIL